MTEEKKSRTPLILKQQPRFSSWTTAAPNPVGTQTYRHFTNPKNPFEIRRLAALKEMLELDPETAARLFTRLSEQGNYQVHYGDDGPSHQKRRMVSGPAAKSSPSPVYPAQSKLKEDQQRLRPFIKTFFEHIMGRLRDHPEHLPWIVNELVPLFEQQQIKLKIYDAFRQFNSWYQFINTMEKLSEDYELENFEMFCCALFGYYSQWK